MAPNLPSQNARVFPPSAFFIIFIHIWEYSVFCIWTWISSQVLTVKNIPNLTGRVIVTLVFSEKNEMETCLFWINRRYSNAMTFTKEVAFILECILNQSYRCIIAHYLTEWRQVTIWTELYIMIMQPLPDLVFFLSMMQRRVNWCLVMIRMIRMIRMCIHCNHDFITRIPWVLPRVTIWIVPIIYLLNKEMTESCTLPSPFLLQARSPFFVIHLIR